MRNGCEKKIGFPAEFVNRWVLAEYIHLPSEVWKDIREVTAGILSGGCYCYLDLWMVAEYPGKLDPGISRRPDDSRSKHSENSPWKNNGSGETGKKAKKRGMTVKPSLPSRHTYCICSFPLLSNQLGKGQECLDKS
jgi:hypothetical protein